MNQKSLDEIFEDLKYKRNCSGCNLENDPNEPFVIKPEGKVKVVVITESPWIKPDLEEVLSIVNIPTFVYLYTLFNGKFFPKENATVYWTHTCKCPLKNVSKGNPIRTCTEAYLNSELLAIEPELVVAVGVNALRFFSKNLKLIDTIFAQRNGIFQRVSVNHLSFKLIVVPHPSRRNRIWNLHSDELIEIFKVVRKEISKYLS